MPRPKAVGDGGDVNRASGKLMAAEDSTRKGARGPGGARWTASDLGLHAGISICLFAGLLLFYGSYYSVHQDVAGSALSGRLAVALGDAFGDYAIYFPPAEDLWFSAAARLADLTRLRLDLATVLMTATAVLFSAAFAYRIRRATVGASPLFLVLPAAVLVILPILFKNVFGLREHMVALGLWPYLVLRVSDPDGTRIGWRTRAFLGVWVGATLLFKYLYCVVVFLVEAADALVRRRPRLLFRIENIVASAIVALYLFLWLGTDPSQRAAIRAMFSAIDANLVDTKTNWLQVAKNFYFAILVLLACRIFRLPARLTALGFAVLVGTIIAAWSQGRWYSHHLFPITMAYIGWWWMVGSGFKWWAHVIVPLYLIIPVGTEYLKTAPYQEAVAELESALDEGGQRVAGKRVGILTMHPSPYNQYLASHGAFRWNSMMNNAYVAAELKPFDRPENEGKLPPPVRLDDPGRRMLHDEMLRLWEDMPPDVLILDRSYRWPLQYVDVDWEHEFSEDPRFNAILKNYRPILTHQGKRLRFKYYIRAN
jgi:hypothetical protein